MLRLEFYSLREILKLTHRRTIEPKLENNGCSTGKSNRDYQTCSPLTILTDDSADRSRIVYLHPA